MQSTCLMFGSLVAFIGLLLVYSNVRSYRRHRRNFRLSDVDQRFFREQYSRRIQTSALTVTFGALIGICGYLKFRESPVFATFYVLGLLILSLWLILLAVSDVLATRVHATRLDRDTRDARQTLQETLDEVRRAHGLE